jgi:hypothetical protein
MCAKRLEFLLALTALSVFAACNSDESSGVGTLRVKISGEEAAQSGYPVGSGDDEIAFADGWTFEFEKVLVSLTDFKLQAADGDDAEVEAGPVVADLHLGEPQLWRFDDVGARRWDRVGYRFASPTSKAKKANDVEDADIEQMADEGYSILIEATAKKGDRAIPLEFGFAFEVVMTRCENGMDMTDGIVVSNNAVNDAQVTVHLDHLFFDTFAVDDASLHFDPLAAVAPKSGPLTLADLAKQTNLSDLKDADGKPLDLAYDPGSVFNPVPKNLEEYVVAAGTTTGHWNGEGHCTYMRK